MGNQLPTLQDCESQFFVTTHVELCQQNRTTLQFAKMFFQDFDGGFGGFGYVH